MASGLLPPAHPARLPSPDRLPFGFEDSVWRSPLVGAALALTAGIVLDRYLGIPLLWSLLAAPVALIFWWVARTAEQRGLPLIYLALSGVAVGAAYHRWYEEVYPSDDIGHFVTPDPRPARLRGVIDEEPVIVRQPPRSPLQGRDRMEPTVAIVRVTQLCQADDWVGASGRVRLVVTVPMEGLHVGDEIEIVGRLAAPPAPANPGEWDYAAALHNQRIRALVLVQKTPEGVTGPVGGGRGSFWSWLAFLRGWGQGVLHNSLPPKVSGLAMALLLGEGSTMTSSDWQKYMRTGVIHVLAISGQHLVVLGFFLAWLFRSLMLRSLSSHALIVLCLVSYALLVGGRPSVLRAVVMVCAVHAGLLFRHHTLRANSFALGWIVVTLVNPTDLFNTGCQLSFLAVALFFWGPTRWLASERYPLRWGLALTQWATHPGIPLGKDPLDRFIDQTRPRWRKWLDWLQRQVVASYVISLLIWLAVAPLVAARYHLVSPLAVVIGPPLLLLTSLALIAGFPLLLAAAIYPPVVPLIACGTQWSLAACDWLVDVADAMPGGYWYVSKIPDWWLWVFYVALLALLTQKPLQRQRRWVVPIGMAWCCLGLVSGSVKPFANELRCTFLAVGHGGCTVLETPDGRTLLYDAGAMAGPDVTRFKIAPFLWHRGIRRIDEVFLSHGDLDHFNGLPALLERFVIGQVTCTPTFADKATPGVELTVATLQQHGIPVRIVRAGDRLAIGEVAMEVLHPPATGPDGNENARSLVMLVRHAGHSLLLTGDLEGLGLERVLALPPLRVDVLMAPHHGSRTANTPALAQWARPQLVVSCEGPPRGGTRVAEPYSAQGALFLGTWPHGAITMRSQPGALLIETFQTGRRVVVRQGPNP